MNAMHAPSSWRRLGVGCALVVLLIAVYFFTFNGYAVSRDEWFLFDATESMARRGTLEQNYEFDAYPPLTIEEAEPPPADTEPLQPVLAAPLFWVAQTLPAIGLAHTTWQFNLLVTTLTAGVVYAYGLALDYRARVAALTAGAFGLGTIAWPYSRTFFREPLFTLLALLSAYLVMRLRRQLAAGQRPLGTLAALGLALTGALLSKEASLLIVPVMVVEAIPARLSKRPARGWTRPNRRVAGVLVGLAILITALLVLTLNADRLFGLSNRYAFTERMQQARDNLSEASEGITGYLFSPARSIWFFSPVLILGFFGWRRLLRERRGRQIAVPLVALLTFVLGYAIVRGSPDWYGGLGWGARYLVPVTPFLALWLLPVFQALLEPATSRWHRWGAGLVLALSVGIQVLAAVVSVNHYYDTLAAQQPPVIPWQEDVWNVRWSPLYVSLELLGERPANFAWQHAVGDTWLLPGGSIALAGLALILLVWWVRQPGGTRRAWVATTAGLGLATALVLGLGLLAIRRDPRYGGHIQPTHDLLTALEIRIAADDVIVLNDPLYAEFFMNYYKRREPVVYTLPVSPGERTSPELPPPVESSNPDDLIYPPNTLVLSYLGQRHERLWLIINTSRFIPWSVRPVEWYLARHFFPITEIKTTDTARAVSFLMTPAPPPTAASWPEHRTDAAFGDDQSLRLMGYDLPGGVVRRPGDILPVSLLWQATAPIAQDYTVGLLLMDDDRLIAQRDSFPVNFFAPTQSWRPGSLHRDNHGLTLPDDLPPGEYELWVVLYWWQTPNERLPVTGPDGQPLGDHVILTTITIE